MVLDKVLYHEGDRCSVINRLYKSQVNKAYQRSYSLSRQISSEMGVQSWYLTKPPRLTQPGHPSMSRRSEYWRWLWPSLGKKQRVLRNSRPYSRFYKTMLQSVKDAAC